MGCGCGMGVVVGWVGLWGGWGCGAGVVVGWVGLWGGCGCGMGGVVVVRIWLWGEVGVKWEWSVVVGCRSV